MKLFYVELVFLTRRILLGAFRKKSPFKYGRTKAGDSGDNQRRELVPENISTDGESINEVEDVSIKPIIRHGFLSVFSLICEVQIRDTSIRFGLRLNQDHQTHFIF